MYKNEKEKRDDSKVQNAHAKVLGLLISNFKRRIRFVLATASVQPRVAGESSSHGFLHRIHINHCRLRLCNFFPE